MKTPPKKSAEDLRHPKNRRSSFNGDEIRPAESQGFESRRNYEGLTVVHGTRKPSLLQAPKLYPARPQQANLPTMSYTRPPSPAQRRAEEAQIQREAQEKPLTARQKKMLKGK